MNHQQLEIPIVAGWDSLKFHNGLFPNDRIIINLLRPDITNPTQSIVQWYKLHGYARIPDLGSQLLLQAWSNSIVRAIQTEQQVSGHLLDRLCCSQGENYREARYYDAVLMYIGALFPARVQNLRKFASAAMQLTSLYGQYRAERVLPVGNNYEPLVSVDPNSGEVIDSAHKSELRARFLDYRLADDYMNALFLEASQSKGDEFLAYLKYAQERRDRYVKSRSDNYHQREAESISRIVRQCPYCHLWYERTFKNGKLWGHCGQKPCERAGERQRHPSKTPDGWECGYPKRRRCKICTRSRQVNIDKVCCRCFSDTIEK
jgi:hypothetical protein